MSQKNKLSLKQQTLFKAIDDILWQDWDPINMKGNQGPRDEYYSYVPTIFSMRIKDATATDIATKLLDIESGSFGYGRTAISLKNCEMVAEKIVSISYQKNK